MAAIQVWTLLEGDRRESVTPWKPLKELLEFLDGAEVLPVVLCRWLSWMRALDHGLLKARNLHQELVHESFESQSSGTARRRSNTNLEELECKALAADRKGRGFVPPENSGRPTMLGFFRQ